MPCQIQEVVKGKTENLDIILLITAKVNKTRLNVLPEAFAAAWDGAHTPQQTHGFFSRVRAPKTQILCSQETVSLV